MKKATIIIFLVVNAVVATFAFGAFILIPYLSPISTYTDYTGAEYYQSGQYLSLKNGALFQSFLQEYHAEDAGTNIDFIYKDFPVENILLSGENYDVISAGFRYSPGQYAQMKEEIIGEHHGIFHKRGDYTIYALSLQPLSGRYTAVKIAAFCDTTCTIRFLMLANYVEREWNDGTIYTALCIATYGFPNIEDTDTQAATPFPQKHLGAMV